MLATIHFKKISKISGIADPEYIISIFFDLAKSFARFKQLLSCYHIGRLDALKPQNSLKHGEIVQNCTDLSN